MGDEKSAGGSSIIRHSEMAELSATVEHADDERLTAHLDRHVGGEPIVWHEIISDRVHIDVHAVPPHEGHPYWVVMTSGMSALPMTVPEDVDDRADLLHAELYMLLPASWSMDEASFSDERSYWPIRLLKTLARLPHDYATWLGHGHSIPNGDPAEPYARGTKLSGAIIVSSQGLGAEFGVVPGSPPIRMYQVLPVTNAEMDMKLRIGTDEALAQLEHAMPNVFGPIDPSRASATGRSSSGLLDRLRGWRRR
jgi:hypothetical protein